DEMRRTGLTVFLDVSVEEILRRLSTDQVEGRPLFKGKTDPNEVREELLSLQSARRSIYKQAELRLAGAELEPTAAQRLIYQAWQKRSPTST
ncbi:MAG: hypothetical protein HC842_08865, partial [Cytophagales bacterium]|nr:hypothetical protein [Cytophagales bacterium]